MSQQQNKPHEPYPTYVYVVVREDILVSDQMCQVGHAAILAGHHYKLAWCSNIVVGTVKDKRKLFELMDKLERSKVEYKAFFEPDDDLGFTSLCTEPLEGEKRKALKGLNLFKDTLR